MVVRFIIALVLIVIAALIILYFTNNPPDSVVSWVLFVLIGLLLGAAAIVGVAGSALHIAFKG